MRSTADVPVANRPGVAFLTFRRDSLRGWSPDFACQFSGFRAQRERIRLRIGLALVSTGWGTLIAKNGPPPHPGRSLR